MNEVWLAFESEDDEEATYEANTTLTETGYKIEWSHTAVGLVTTIEFDTLADAYDWYEEHGFEYYGEGE